MIERLTLGEKSIAAMAEGLRQIAQLPDPVGEITELRYRPSGIQVGRMRVPLGVIGIIYESRPNVTCDAAILCLKTGNATILRGGSEAFHSNTAIAVVMSAAIARAGLPGAGVQFVPTTDREAIPALCALDRYIDVMIPRGGHGLIETVVRHARMPVIKHYHGICHVYVDREADAGMAEEIIVNGKCQRPGVCNAVETVLIHEDIARDFLPRLARTLREHRVELRGDDACLAIVPDMIPATEEDWSTEYLELILSIRIVPGIDAALDHLDRYGSHHSDCIVTANQQTAREFLAACDSATVYWNASTRFTDGAEFGFGAEIGISTDKLHARGPMALEELCSYKYEILGTGQIRS